VNIVESAANHRKHQSGGGQRTWNSNSAPDGKQLHGGTIPEGSQRGRPVDIEDLDRRRGA
jgi:hypothetical protein